MNAPLPTREVRLDIPGPVTLITIPTESDAYETRRLEEDPEGILIELRPEPVLLQEE